MQPKRTIQSRRRGLRVVGPGFYLWERDAGEALRLAAELSWRAVGSRGSAAAASVGSRSPRPPRPAPR